MKIFGGKGSKTPPTPPPATGPDTEPAWHKRYGTVVDENGNTVRNWQNWGRCECNLDADHDL